MWHPTEVCGRRHFGTPQAVTQGQQTLISTPLAYRPICLPSFCSCTNPPSDKYSHELDSWKNTFLKDLYIVGWLLTNTEPMPWRDSKDLKVFNNPVKCWTFASIPPSPKMWFFPTPLPTRKNIPFWCKTYSAVSPGHSSSRDKAL